MDDYGYDLMGNYIMEDQEEHTDSDEDDVHEDEVHVDDPSKTGLKKSLTKFIEHTSARDFLLGESPTLRLVEALEEQNLDHVKLAIKQGARINFQNLNLLEHIESINIQDHDRYDRRYYGQPSAKRFRKEAEERKSRESWMSAVYRYLICKDPSLLTTKGALSVFKLNDKALNQHVIGILLKQQSPVLFELYGSIFGTEKTHTKNYEIFIDNYGERRSGNTTFVTGKGMASRMSITDHYQEILDKISLFHKIGLDFTTTLGEDDNKTSWQYFCNVFIFPWFQRNVDNNFSSYSYPDVSIGHMYIKAMTESNNKAGLPTGFKVECENRRNASDLITSFMQGLFRRRLLTFNQLNTETVSVLNKGHSWCGHYWSLLDCILNDKPEGQKLNNHNRYVMAQLIVNNFYQFMGQLSDNQLVRIAYMTVAKIPEIICELLVFCQRDICVTHNQPWLNPSWVVSELRDIISSGIIGMGTIHRLNKLDLPKDDALDGGDLIVGLKRHLKIREKKIEELKLKAQLYEPEVNKFVNSNCGLNATANNALIVELVRRSKERSEK